MGRTEPNLDERRVFYRLIEAKLPIAEIARVMGRHRSRLYLEVKRNFHQDQEVPAASGYFPVTAQNMAEGRRRRQRKLIRCPQLREVVIDRLKHDWSPEQTAGRLKVDGIAPVTVSHETIYKFIDSKSGKALELGRLFPSRRRKRVPRYARKARGNTFPDTVSIKHRPNCINERKEFGHWEGDLMIFERAQGHANIATIVERKSRYTVLSKNNNRRSRPLMDKPIGRLSPLPATARQSTTFDRGFEFVSWREFDKGMGIKSWFCDPQAPWQKGSVEIMNKRIRRRLPRHAAILSMTDPELHQVDEILNATPRKCLGYRTPAEVFRDCLL